MRIKDWMLKFDILKMGVGCLFLLFVILCVGGGGCGWEKDKVKRSNLEVGVKIRWK